MIYIMRLPFYIMHVNLMRCKTCTERSGAANGAASSTSLDIRINRLIASDTVKGISIIPLQDDSLGMNRSAERNLIITGSSQLGRRDNFEWRLLTSNLKSLFFL